MSCGGQPAAAVTAVRSSKPTNRAPLPRGTENSSRTDADVFKCTANADRYNLSFSGGSHDCLFCLDNTNIICMVLLTLNVHISSRKTVDLADIFSDRGVFSRWLSVAGVQGKTTLPTAFVSPWVCALYVWCVHALALNYTCIYIYIKLCYGRVPSEFHRRQMFFFGSTGPPSCGHGGKTCLPAYLVCGGAAEGHGDDCRRHWRGATLPHSVTVGDRLAQKSDRHRPLSLRPVSLRRRIYMQFLLIVLLCRDGFGGGAPLRHRYHHRRRRHLCNSAYRNNRTRAGVTKKSENIKNVRRRFLNYFFILIISARFLF